MNTSDAINAVHRFSLLMAGAALTVLAPACSHPEPSGPDCSLGGGQGATSLCLTPHQTPAYYVDQSQKYFDTLDSSADPKNIPTYSTLVARWEWPPWLKLTGYGSDVMIQTDKILTNEAPSTVPTRECQGFSVQPFGRCHVSFQFSGGACPIYEEFTFNDQGAMTFIEAWSDAAGLLPTTNTSDRWAEGSGVHRLSTKVPGLGNATGLINLDAAWMRQAASRDPEIADFVSRAENFWPTWTDSLQDAGPNLYARGCGW